MASQMERVSDRPALDCASTRVRWTRAPIPSVRLVVRRRALERELDKVRWSARVAVPPTRSSEFGSMDALSIGSGLDARFTRRRRACAPICLSGPSDRLFIQSGWRGPSLDVLQLRIHSAQLMRSDGPTVRCRIRGGFEGASLGLPFLSWHRGTSVGLRPARCAPRNKMLSPGIEPATFSFSTLLP